MQNEELNRKISELREPTPIPSDPETADDYIVIVAFLSIGGSWVYQPGRTYAENPEPRDWTGDENASAVLLEEMLSAGFAIEMWPQAADPRIILVARKVIGVGPTVEYGRGHLQPDRKTAIATCWLAWKESQ